VSCTDTWPTVLDWLVCDGELAEVVANHFWLDFNLVEFLSRVDADDASNHLRNDNHITQMCLDEIRLLVWLCLLLCFAELLDETHGLALQATVEPASGAGVDDIAELLGGEVKELVEVNAAVGELAESSALLQLYMSKLVSVQSSEEFPAAQEALIQ